jgi:peptide/nickel transport system permease protein
MSIAAFVLAPSSAGETFDGFLNAPPTRIHLRDASGAWHAPFIYRLRLVSQLEQRYEIDEATRIPLAWFTRGHLVESSQPDVTPLLLLGTDSFGHDVFSRLVFGGRTSLALSMVAALGAVLLGAALGGIAGYAGGLLDDVLMRVADFVIVLPATYVALALRSTLPLVLPASAVFAWLAVIFAVLGAPIVARGVRATVRSERGLDYAVAAASLGSSHTRILLKHLLPATRGFLAVQLTVLVPAFILAEATLSYVGFGFPDTTATWGTMLREASSVNALISFPWLLTPAVAIFLMTLGVNLWLQDRTGLMDHTRYN